MSMGSYAHYRLWCERLGVAPASEETYEKVTDPIGSNILCDGCHRVPVSYVGDACQSCMRAGHTSKLKVRKKAVRHV